MTIQQKDKPDKPDKIQTMPSDVRRQALTLDVDYYQSLMDDADISEDKKREFVEALWSIVVCFVDLGFGIHPLQQVGETGQNGTGQELYELIAGMDLKPLELQQSERENTPERRDA